MDFLHQTVIVTGAGRGIGRATARMYAAHGAAVAVADKNEGAALAVAQGIREEGGRALGVAVDVRRPESIVALMDQVMAEFGRIDVLINNAGIMVWESPYDLSVETWDDVLDTNLRGPFLCSREGAKRMRLTGGGAIVNIASTRAVMSEPGTEAYGAAKGGLLALTHALAISLGPDGIRVNAVSPGWIETGDYGALRKEDHGQHPAGRVGLPEDVARACLFLTQRENSFVTGANLVIDGGMTRKMIYLE